MQNEELKQTNQTNKNIDLSVNDLGVGGTWSKNGLGHQIPAFTGHKTEKIN